MLRRAEVSVRKQQEKNFLAFLLFFLSLCGECRHPLHLLDVAARKVLLQMIAALRGHYLHGEEEVFLAGNDG